MAKNVIVIGYYQRLFKHFQNDSELITGMLLCLKSSSFVHVIEVSYNNDMLMYIMYILPMAHDPFM